MDKLLEAFRAIFTAFQPKFDYDFQKQREQFRHQREEFRRLRRNRWPEY